MLAGARAQKASALSSGSKKPRPRDFAITQEGWLSKRTEEKDGVAASSLKKKSKDKRYFVLLQRDLVYYKDEKAAGNGGEQASPGPSSLPSTSCSKTTRAVVCHSLAEGNSGCDRSGAAGLNPAG